MLRILLVIDSWRCERLDEDVQVPGKHLVLGNTVLVSSAQILGRGHNKIKR